MLYQIIIFPILFERNYNKYCILNQPCLKLQTFSRSVAILDLDKTQNVEVDALSIEKYILCQNRSI